jgi:ABC-2 type transport system permease protein
MSGTGPSTVRVALAFLAREYRISLTYRFLFLAQGLGVFFTVATTWFVAKIVDPSAFESGGYFAFVIVALFVSTLLTAALPGLARNVREEQQRGTLEAILALGVSPVAFSLGAGAGPVLFAVPQVLLLGLLGALFGVELSGADWPVATAALLLGTVSFVGLGMVGSAAVLAFRRAEAVIGWLLVALTFAAGEFFPPELLPEWVRVVSLLSPVTWSLEIVRGALLEGWGWSRALGGLAALMAIAAASCAGGVLGLSAAITHSRRRGTLALY